MKSHGNDWDQTQDQLNQAYHLLGQGLLTAVANRTLSFQHLVGQLQTCYGIQSSSTYILILIFTSRWFLFFALRQ